MWAVEQVLKVGVGSSATVGGRNADGLDDYERGALRTFVANIVKLQIAGAEGQDLSKEIRDLVRGSWGRVLVIQGVIGELFYSRLLATCTELMSLFNHTDMDLLVKRFFAMLDLIVTNIDHSWDLLRPTLERLGRRHLHYGALPHHYSMVSFSILFFTCTKY